MAVILAVIGLATIIINIVTLIILCTCARLLVPANYPVISFLITGILQGLVVVPAYAVKRLELTNSPDWICDLFRFPYFLCGHMLTLNILMVALDRVIAIKFPFRYENIASKRRMTLALSLLWLLFIIIDLSPFINGSNIANSKCVYVPWSEWSIAVLILTIVVPMLVIIVGYAWIWNLAVKHARQIQRGGKSESFRKRLNNTMELKATKTSALLVGMFFLCWAPIGIYYLVENLCDGCVAQTMSVNMQEDFKFWVKAISFLSCIFSPLAYCWRTREFRKEFHRSLRRHDWRVAGLSVKFVNRIAKQSQVDVEVDMVTVKHGNSEETLNHGNVSETNG